MSIPTGIAPINFQQHTPEFQHVSIVCEVEIMMVAFTTGNCRVRGKFLETKGWRVAGDSFGAYDTPLTPYLLAIISNSLQESHTDNN